jgi:signal transduction histidine kinase
LKDYSGYVREDKDGQIFTLQYDERDFGFDVVGIGFSLPGRTNYRYLLENYDNEWHDIGNLRHVSFTNIPPGKYIFKVQCSDSFGNWETTGASVNVFIKAPFWTNKWLWMASGLSLTGLFIFGYYFRINQLTVETKKLESMVDERTQKIKLQKSQIESQNEELLTQAAFLEEKNTELERAKGLLEIEVKYLHQHQLLKSSIQTQEVERKRIAQDLHDELGAVLSISRMHLVQIQNEKATNSTMQSGIQQARMLTEAALATMRRISHELMPPQLENFGLIKTLEAIIAQMQEAKKITVNFHVSDELLRWSLPIELGLYRICMELINNTLKHAEATQIKITLKQLPRQLLFSYSDNGKGLPAEVHAGHGFKNIEARANIIGGELAMGNSEHGGFYATIKIVGIS